MATPLIDAKDQIATLWAALTPPDRTAVTYHQVAARVAGSGDSSDRSFWFLMPNRQAPAAEAGVTASQVFWDLRAQLRLSQAGRSQDALFEAVANEIALLTRTIEKQSSWPSGVWSVETLETETELAENGDALITFLLRVLVGETD